MKHTAEQLQDARDRALHQAARRLEQTIDLINQAQRACDAMGDDNFADILRESGEGIWDASRPVREHADWLRSVGR